MTTKINRPALPSLHPVRGVRAVGIVTAHIVITVIFGLQTSWGHVLAAESNAAETQKQLDVLEKELQALLAADKDAILQRQAAHAKDLESEPLIPDAPGIPTKNDFLGEQFEYRRRVVTAYTEHSQDPPNARRPGLEFLEAYVRFSSDQPDAVTADELSKLGDVAMAAGSRDPIVMAYHTRAREQLQQLPANDALLKYQAIFESLRIGAYPPALVRFQLTVWKNKGLRAPRLPDSEMQALRGEAFRAAEAYLTADGSRTSPAIALAQARATLFPGAMKANDHQGLYQACLAGRRVHPWILHMLAGEYYYRLAWEYRGGGFADSVTPEGFAKFNEYLPRAGEHFKRAWFLHPELVEAPAKLIQVANASNTTGWRAEQWFHEAVKAQVDDEDAYKHYAWSLMPRWGGSQEQLVDFGRRCLLSGRWDTSVPRRALEILRNLKMDVPTNQRPGQNPHVAALSAIYLDSLLSAIESSRASAADYAYDLAVVSAHLIEAGDFARVRSAFEVAGEDDAWAWTVELGIGYRYALGIAYAATGPAASKAAIIHEALFVREKELRTIGDDERLLSIVQEAQSADDQPRAQWFYRVARTMLHQRRQFEAGEWVSLGFDAEMSSWLTHAAHIEIIDDTTVRLRCYGGTNGMCLQPLVTFQRPFEIQAEVKVVSLIDGYAFTGIVYNAPRWTRRKFPQVVSAGQWVRVEQTHLREKDKTHQGPFVAVNAPSADGFVSLAIRVWPEVLEFRGQGKRVHLDPEFPVEMTDHLHFGNILNAGSAGEALFRNLRIRKLVDEPPTADADEAVAAAPSAPQTPKAASSAERLKLAETLMLSMRLDEARQQINLVLMARPVLPGADRVSGDISYRQQDYAAARAAYEREVQRNPDDDYSQLLLAWVLSAAPEDSVRDGRKAVEIMEGIKRRNGERYDQYITYRTTYVAALAEIKDFAAAKAMLAGITENGLSEFDLQNVTALKAAIGNDRPFRLAPKPPRDPARQLDSKKF